MAEEHSVYVGTLGDHANDDDLYECFGKFGKVKDGKKF